MGAGYRPGHLRPQRRGRAGGPSRLRRHRLGVRAHDLRARAEGPDGCPTLAFTPDFRLPGVRLLPRGHHARAAPRHSARTARCGLLRKCHPAIDVLIIHQVGLPPPDREVRPRSTRAARRPGRWPRDGAGESAAEALGLSGVGPVPVDPGSTDRPARAGASWGHSPLDAAHRALGAKTVPFGGLGHAAVLRGGHAGRAPGLPHRRGRVRREPPRHRAGAGARRLRRLQAALTNDLTKIGRAGRSTRTCSTRPTGRCSTTSSCGGSPRSGST